MEGLQICPSSIEITSVVNMSKNMNNEWNEVNYTKELKEKNKDFVLAHDESKLGIREPNHKVGTTLCRELKALRGTNESRP